MSRRYAVEFSPEALEHAVACEQWWFDNRPKAPGLFALELAAAVARLEDFPRETRGLPA